MSAILGSGLDTAALTPGRLTWTSSTRGDVSVTVVDSQPIDDRLRLTTIVVEDDNGAEPLAVDAAMRRITTAVLRPRLHRAKLGDAGHYVLSGVLASR